MHAVDATCMTCDTPIRWDPIAPRLCLDCYCKLRERTTSIIQKAEAIMEAEAIIRQTQEKHS